MTELLVLACSFALLWELRTIEQILRRIEATLEQEDHVAIAGFTELPSDEDEE